MDVEVVREFGNLMPGLRLLVGRWELADDFWEYLHEELTRLGRNTMAHPELEKQVRHELLQILLPAGQVLSSFIFEGRMTLSDVFALVDCEPRSTDALSSIHGRQAFMNQALRQNFGFDGVPTRARRGGYFMKMITRLRGPVQFIEMQGQGLTLLLLGDHHDGTICRARCDAPGCKTLQPVKATRSGPITGVDMSFLQFLEDELGPVRPDVFLEAWMPDDVRRGTAEYEDYRGPMDAWDRELAYNTGALDAVNVHAAPCVNPVTRGTAACAYKNVRFHGVDPRVHDGLLTPLAHLREAVYAHKGASAAVCKFLVWVKAQYPVFSVEEVVRGCLDPDALASVTNRFCQYNGRVYKEFLQLPVAWQQALLRATTQMSEVVALPYDLAGAVVGWLAQVASAASGIVAVDLTGGRGFDVKILDGPEAAAPAHALPDLVLHPTVQADLRLYMQQRPYTTRAIVETNLYAIARALKTRKDGTRARVVVMNLGWVHTELIARTLRAAGLMRVAGAQFSGDKCLALDGADDGAWERPQEPEEEDVDMADHFGDVEGTSVETDADTVPVIPRAPFGVPLADVEAWEEILLPETA